MTTIVEVEKTIEVPIIQEKIIEIKIDVPQEVIRYVEVERIIEKVVI